MLIVNSFIGYILFNQVEIIMHSVVTHEFIHHINVGCGRYVGEGVQKEGILCSAAPWDPWRQR